MLGELLGLSARQLSDLHAAGVVAGPSGDPRGAH
ncbi:dehydratase/racemase [Bordetella pertussis]|nr:dehydratase/racemase [Bordetella pertussis]